MICPHCNQGILHQETSHFGSNLDPDSFGINGHEGMTCKVCGHWKDIIVIAKPDIPIETHDRKYYDGALQKKLSTTITEKIIKYFDYIDFLRNNGYSWDRCAKSINVSRTALFKIFNKLKLKEN